VKLKRPHALHASVKWRGRIATIATTATFFLVGIVGAIAMILLFPEPDEGEFDARQLERKARHEEPSAAAIADEYSAYRQDQGNLRWKVVPVVVLAFASAYFVSKRLKPTDQN
jgi:hypothetical protein